MKILKKSIASKNGEGYVRLEATEPEDMYCLYNLISNGDLITASTVRNVVKETSTGSSNKSRVHIRLKIEVERVEFDYEQCSLRLNGRNKEENEHVRLGQFHTLELVLGEAFSLEKVSWDSVYLEQLDDACDPSKKAEIAAVVMQEGLANVCLITSSMTLTKAKIEKTIPKKKGFQALGIEKAKQSFFESIYSAIKRHINFDVVKVVLLGSPGFLKDDFMTYFDETTTRTGDTSLHRNKSKFLRVHTSTGYKKAIHEMLADPDLQARLGDVKAMAEVRALESFHRIIGEDQDRACYGLKSVQYADEQLAIDSLLVSDKLFKAADIHTRKRYVDLVESVKGNGGQVFLFSSMHVSGAQLELYTGVAAILRYPLPEPEEEEEVEEKKIESIRTASVVGSMSPSTAAKTARSSGTDSLVAHGVGGIGGIAGVKSGGGGAAASPTAAVVHCPTAAAGALSTIVGADDEAEIPRNWNNIFSQDIDGLF